MGKAKKGKKETGNAEETTSDVDVKQTEISDEEAENKKNVKKQPAKKEKKKPAAKKEDSENEDADVDSADEDAKKVKAKAKPAKKGKKVEEDEDGEEEVEEKVEKKKKPKATKKAAAKPAAVDFSLLMGSDDDDGGNEDTIRDDDDEEETPKSKKKEEPAKAGKKSKKEKKKKKGESDDDDIEKLMAELELEYSGAKKEPEAEPAKEEEKKDKKKDKKAAKKEEVVEEKKEDDGEVRLKTAAEKKKEKKERQKKEKQDEKQKEPTPVPVEVEKKEEATKPGKKKGKKDEPEPEPVPAPSAAKEGEKKKKGGLSKAMLAVFQEQLKLKNEVEERLRKEEEEKVRNEEMAEEYRLEQIKLEQERKDKKKLKDKERKERLKAEGKLLTNKQKMERARAQAMLESLKAQGVEVPEVGGEKKVRLGTRVRPNKNKNHDLKREDSEEQAESKEVTPAPEDEAKAVEEVTVEEKPKEDDVKDSWDISDSEEEKVDLKKKTKKPESAEESDDEEDDDDSDEDDDSEDDDEDDSEEEDHRTEAEKMRERALTRIAKRTQEAEAKRTLEDLRAAVVCVLGHVDTGKTKILDKLRRTNVQDGEAGGITQQIGATNVPIMNIQDQTKFIKGYKEMTFKLPGLLIIDTPGHESFSNLRSRGSSLCDIAILVVDIMHGLEPQTIESINLLKAKRTPFVVALNKMDRLYNWETMNRRDIRDVLEAQAGNTKTEFRERTNNIIVQFAEQSLNAALFYENPDPKSYISLVPTSAITGEGMGNLLFLIVQYCQERLAKRLMFSEDLQATVLEVKAIPGLGTTIDAILINGRLREGDTMILAGTEGPIVTQVKALLMPQPMKELRVKNAYIEHKEIIAAQGVKIAAKELEKAIAGLNLQIAQKPDEVEIFKDIVARELKSVLNSIKLSERGVYVQASTLGSLEALLEFLKTSKIPYCGIRIGPVVKRDVIKASAMLEHENQYATILAFDVKVEREAQEMADNVGVKIFQADIIYHLFDKFTAYRDEIKARKREEFKSVAVFPCKLKILPQFIFNSRDPIVMGVIVEAGIVKEGTPICVPSKEFVHLGVVTSIECNHKQIETARKGQEVCIKIDPIPGEAPKMFGRHFEETDMLVSKISRQSIDACKEYFRDDLLKSDWTLMVELKKTFEIL